MRFPQMSGNAWVCTIITVLLVAVGAEQAVRTVTGEPAPPPAPPQEVGLMPGDMAPDFTLPDEKGRKFSLSQFRGKPVMVSFFCGCSRCEDVAKQLAPWQKKKNVPAIGLVTFKPEYMAEFRKNAKVDYPLVLDEGKEVAAKWDSMICPRVWVVDAKGHAVASNPREPEMLPTEATVQIVKEAYANPVAPAAPKPKVAARS